MAIEYAQQADGGTIIAVNGVQCRYWYPDEGTIEEATREAEQYYRELQNGRELRQRAREDQELIRVLFPNL